MGLDGCPGRVNLQSNHNFASEWNFPIMFGWSAIWFRERPYFLWPDSPTKFVKKYCYITAASIYSINHSSSEWNRFALVLPGLVILMTFYSIRRWVQKQFNQICWIFSPNLKGRVLDTQAIELLKKKNMMERKFSGIKFIR